jgi:hypothetical protein
MYVVGAYVNLRLYHYNFEGLSLLPLCMGGGAISVCDFALIAAYVNIVRRIRDHRPYETTDISALIRVQTVTDYSRSLHFPEIICLIFRAGFFSYM